MFTAAIVGVIVGYVAAIYTWPTVKELANGIEAEAEKAKDRFLELKAKLGVL